MIGAWRLREPWLRVCWSVHDGATFAAGAADGTGTVAAVLKDDGARLARFGARAGLPRSVASVPTAMIVRFLGGVPRFVHGLLARADRPQAVAVLPGGAAAVLVAESGAVNVVRLPDGALTKTLPFEDATDVCVSPHGSLYLSCNVGVFRLDSCDFTVTGVMKGFSFHKALSVSADETIAVVRDRHCVVVFENCSFVAAMPMYTLDEMSVGAPVVVPNGRCFAVQRWSCKDCENPEDFPQFWEYHVLSLTGELLRRIPHSYLHSQLLFSLASEAIVVGDDEARCHDADAVGEDEARCHDADAATFPITSWLHMRAYFACSNGKPFRLVRATLHHDALHVVAMFDDEDYARWCML